MSGVLQVYEVSGRYIGLDTDNENRELLQTCVCR